MVRNNFKKGQVWVETVIYTLIALALIGMVLAFALPKIRESQDKIVIDQSLVMMGDIYSKIIKLGQGAPGNQRVIEIQIKEGKLEIDGSEETITFILEESENQFSEVGAKIEQGNIDVLTESQGNLYNINLIADFSDRNIDLLYGENPDGTRTVTKSPTIYKLKIFNNGTVPGEDKTQIKIGVE